MIKGGLKSRIYDKYYSRKLIVTYEGDVRVIEVKVSDSAPLTNKATAKGIPEGYDIFFTHSRHVETVVLLSRVDK